PDNFVLSSSAISHDVGILVLKQNAPVTPLAWQSVRDDSVYTVSSSFAAVGYGITSGGGNDSGTKRTVTLQIQQTGSDGFSFGSSSGNTCGGDSGGPAIKTVASVPTVIGTTSYGDVNCT